MKKLYCFAASLFLLAGCSLDNSNWYDDPVVPVSLAGIETVNIDNSGAEPFPTDDPIRKEAFMIGINWITDDSNPSGNQSITPPYSHKDYPSASIASSFTKRIYSVDRFNANNPAGANVSQYFKQVSYLPDGIDEGFVLLKAPDPGPHTFKVVYISGTKNYECTTATVQLY